MEKKIVFKKIPSEFLATVEKRLTSEPLYENDVYSVVVYEATPEKIDEIPFPEMKKYLSGEMHANDFLIICGKKNPNGECPADEKYYSLFSGNLEIVKSYFETRDVQLCDENGNNCKSMLK